MKDNTNKWDREKYITAWHFASINHSGQKYGGHKKDLQLDYLTHIGQVCMEVIWAVERSEQKCDANLAIQCAILHDTIEDTKVSYQDVLSGFGKDVADGVLALSKNEKLETKREQMKDSLQRINSQPKEIWMVKLADRISNLYQPPFYWDKLKISNYISEAQQIYDALHKANDVLALRLKEKIKSYHRFLN